MAEYKELIKNFDTIRRYIRDFFVYGFRSRNDYAAAAEEPNRLPTRKSARTYDNERRRIESWLKDYVGSTYQSHEKQTAIRINSSGVEENPLYCAWKAKTFTANDIMLHFFLLDTLFVDTLCVDTLFELPEASAAVLCDKLSERYGIIFELQTLRNKLKEYSALGLLSVRKQGRELVYSLTPASAVFSCEPVLDALKFYQEAAPFGYLSSTILEQYKERNYYFRFQHAFFVHTLEDQVLYECILAIHSRQRVCITLQNRRVPGEGICFGVPLQIFVSTQNGRRYLCLYHDKKQRFCCHRLDYISKVKTLGTAPEFNRLKEALARNRTSCWGVSFGGRTRKELLRMVVLVHLPEEEHIVNRLLREGRGGTVTPLSENSFEYCGEFFDANEMLTWVKTFIGRIISLHCSNPWVQMKFYQDMTRMRQMYLEENEENQ